MDYEKKYKEALANMQELYNSMKYMSSTDALHTTMYLEKAFPELKESEDEKIRKLCEVLIRTCFMNELCTKEEKDDCFAWLEKQGEQKSVDFKAKDWYVSKVDGKIHNMTYNPTDKVEPKFKVGDWVVRGNITAQILDIQEQYYVGIDTNGNDFTSSRFLSDDKIHLWTIQDAKDGDVLCYKDEISLYKHDIKNCTKQETTFGGFVYHCCYDGKRFIMDSLYSLTEQDKIDIHPATKEQRDILFQKMKETGYEWDAEKKELKIIDWSKHVKYEPIDPSIIEEKPVWTEEDTFKVQRICKYLDEAKKYYADITEVRECMDWIKSLKDRVQPQWKPSEEQISALEYQVNSTYKGSWQYKASKELLEQLKKL